MLCNAACMLVLYMLARASLLYAYGSTMRDNGPRQINTWVATQVKDVRTISHVNKDRLTC